MELLNHTLAVLEGISRQQDIDQPENHRLVPLFPSDDVKLKPKEPTPPQTTPLQLNDWWLLMIDNIWTVGLLVTNNGKQSISNLLLWLQSHDLSPLHSQCTITAKGFLSTKSRGDKTGSLLLNPSSLQPNEMACVVIAMTLPVLKEMELRAVVMATWNCCGSAGYSKVTTVTMSLKDIIATDVTETLLSLQWTDYNDITCNDNKKWREINCLIGSRNMIKLGVNMDSPSQVFSLLTKRQLSHLVAIDDHLLKGISLLDGAALFYTDDNLQAIYRNSSQLELLLKLVNQVLPDGITVSPIPLAAAASKQLEGLRILRKELDARSISSHS